MNTNVKNQQRDYKKLGLKCGLELHQQLDTKSKLFCNCSTDLFAEKPKTTIIRYMRPTLSEMGEFDKAALMEFKKRKRIIYEIPPTTCLYEIDETPPLNVDTEALDIALTIAKLFDMNCLSELHINRKQYLDGSIPNGFQRTMIVGVGGKIKVDNKTINLDMLALEEDSSREIENKGKDIIWRVDRLGIPLIEIATKVIDVENPDFIKEVAKKIGRILRVTQKVKRGLGTIRQDLNISISNGARVEIKGIQILDMLPTYVEQEVERQIVLLEIKKEMEKRELTRELFDTEFKDCKSVFENTNSKLLKEAISKKQSIFGFKIPKMKGLLGKIIQGKKTFGKEIAERIKVIVGLGGLIHTDELPNYGITKKEVDTLLDFFDCENTDAVAFIIGRKDELTKANVEVITRLGEALDGIPGETRHAIDDGTTSFRRYLGTANRMYPDTDSHPIIVTNDHLNKIGEDLPELPENRKVRYIKDYNLPEEIADSLTLSKNAELFDRIMTLKIDPILVAVTLEQTLKALARENLEIEKISGDSLVEIFEYLSNEKITKEAIEPILRYYSHSPAEKLDVILEKENLDLLTQIDLENIIKKIISKHIEVIKTQGKRSEGKIMGLVMEKARGKIDGKIVKETVSKLLHKKIRDLDKAQE